MRPTEILSAEHRVIERALDTLLELTRATPFDRAAAAVVVDFLHTYADLYHHGKEEQLLFPALEAKGLPGHAGPLAVMKNDHEEGRAAVRAMQAALAAEDDAAFRGPAEGFFVLLREHIGKEDGVLFPMADGMLDGDNSALFEGYEAVEAEHGARAEELRQLVLKMAEEFDLPASAPSGGHGMCGSGGGSCSHG